MSSSTAAKLLFISPSVITAGLGVWQLARLFDKQEQIAFREQAVRTQVAPAALCVGVPLQRRDDDCGVLWIVFFFCLAETRVV